MKKALLVCLVCALAWLFVFSGLDWGVPSAGRAALVMAPGLENDAFYDSLVKARNLVYKDTKNIIFASPSLRSDEFAAKDKVVVDYRKDGATFYFSNYMRHYFLCTHDPDENMVFNALANMKPASFDFNPHFFVYGGGLVYPLAGWLKGLSLAGAVELVPDMRYYFRNPDQMGRLYTAGRALCAAMGVLGLLLLALFEFELSGALFWPAALAALFFVSPIVVLWSKTLKPHFYLLPAAALCAVFSYRFLETRNIRYFLAAAAMSGLAAGIALSTGLLVLLPVLAYLQAAMEAPPGLKAAAKELAAAALLLAAGILILNPYYVLSPRELVADMKWITATMHVSGGLGTFYSFFRYGLGIFPSFLFAAAAGICVFDRKRAGAFSLTLLVFILLMMATIYRLPDEPAAIRLATYILLLSFFFIVEVLRRRAGTRGWVKAAVVLCALAGAADALRFRTYAVNDSGLAAGTRARAAEWINRNIPGAGIGHLYDLIPWTFPPARLSEHRLSVYANLDELLKDPAKPEYFVLADIHRYALTAGQRKRLDGLYRVEKEFHNSPELLDMPSLLFAANSPVYVLKKI